MRALNISIIAAGDTQPEKRNALQLIAELNDRYRGRLELRPSLAPEGTAEVTLALVWNEADGVLEEALGDGRATEGLLFRKTTRPAVDLSKRSEIMAKLDAKARLDTLLQANRHFKIVPFDDGGFWGKLERELQRLVERRLGIDSGPVDLRPRLGGTYLPRPRLLKALPDTPGHIVRLEAPYGYGKSVLSAQWAEALEAEGWHTLWLARDPDDADVRPRLTAALGVPADTPDPLLRDRLWERPTLLVVEDLGGEEELGFLLDDLRGLLLLASRNPLRDERLAALEAAGRVTSLGASELAFTRAEAQNLAGDHDLGAALHAETLGWSLPLHIATLTGSAPDARSLLAGIRAGLGESGWHELLLLAALPYLPRASAGPETGPLVDRGFVQALGTSFRLHPFIADIALATYRDAVADAVAQGASRLPLMLRGEAFERVADLHRLVGVLEAVEAEPWRQGPAQIVRWDARVKGLTSPRRHWTVGAAHERLGQYDAAITRLEKALEAPELSADERLGIMRALCVPLGVTDNARGRELIERAEALLGAATPEVAARFLSNAALIHAHAQQPEEAIRLAERALEIYPEDSPFRIAAEVNLALFRYDAYGDFDARLNAQVATLDAIRRTYPVQALGQCRDLGMFYGWLGDRERARRYLEEARDGEGTNPAIGIEARAALAFLDGDRDTVREASRKARLFSQPYLADIVSMYRISQELGAGDLAAARRTFEASPKGVFAACAYARALAAEGAQSDALELLAAFDSADRAKRLYLAASRYLVSRDRRHLDAFLEVTTARTRLLPGFLPLETLPDDPALSEHYPIEEVLRSGRKEAIALREADIPALRLDLLGRTEVRLLGEPLDLTDRQTQIVVLLALGRSRDEVAEILWPEAETKKQRNNLNVQLNALRKAIEPWGVATYLFEDGLRRVASDHGELEEALERGDAEAVLARYREPFAPGVDLSPIDDERGRLREEVVALLFEASHEAPIAEAVTLLERTLELEPLHEEALQRLLVRLVRRGRRREARLRFDRFAERLAEEMGLEPLPDTRSILGL